MNITLGIIAGLFMGGVVVLIYIAKKDILDIESTIDLNIRYKSLVINHESHEKQTCYFSLKEYKDMIS